MVPKSVMHPGLSNNRAPAVGATVMIATLVVLAISGPAAAVLPGGLTNDLLDQGCQGLDDLELNSDQACRDRPDVPDLCDDDGDSFEKVYEVSPDKDALLLLGADTSGVTNIQQDAPDAGTYVLKAGELSYHAEIWKCEDFNGVNEVRYLGYKSGYTGNGAGWSYTDTWSADAIECYYSPELDGGQAICEAWANSPPTYTYTATLTLGSGVATVVATGSATWDTLVAPTLGGAVWIGDFEGVTQDLVPVSGKLLGGPL